jgi:protein-ribulosamine 3-kinase
MLSEGIRNRIITWLAERGEEPFTLLRSAGGGSINAAYSFASAKSRYFLKVNEAGKYPGMFATEASGLSLLAEASTLTVPGVLLCEQVGREQLLVLSFLEAAPETPFFQHDLGKGLAGLHKNSSEKFGLDHANYIGSLPQDNTRTDSWNEFFVCRRIEPLLKLSIDSGRFNANVRRNFEAFFKKLDELFPKERPALLHGDLWSGNKMNTVSGPAIFDPAVYYGHREADLAMSCLFGGFSADFYRGYEEDFPLEKGWRGRVELFNLYPLLVHTVLFGGGYASDVLAVIKKF